MNKIFMVARREFLYNLRRPAFLFSAFGTPLMLLVILLIVAFSSSGDGITSLTTWGKIGYVDNSVGKTLAAGVQPEGYTDLFIPFATTEEAKAAMDNSEIVAYLEVPATYMVSGRVNLYTYQDTPDILDGTIRNFMLMNLVAGKNITIPMERIQDSGQIMVQNANSGRQISEGGVFFTLFLPVIFGFLMVMASMTTSGFLMAGLVEERTNRIMEILVTSITPMQILVGKMVGLALLGLVQIGVLIAAALLGLTVGHNLDFLQGVSLPFDMIVMSVVYFLLTYFLLAALMSGLGVLVNSEQESRQISGLFSVPIMIPYILFFIFITDPNGTVPMVLSFIPITAPMAVLIRMGLTEVPAWQILLSMGIMVVTIVIVVWAAAKLFRWGLLLYGKRFNLREVLRVVFSRRSVVGTSVATTRQEGAA